MEEFRQTEQQKEKKRNKIKNKNGECNLHDLWDNIKWVNIHIIRVPEGEERERDRKCI